MKSRNRLIAFFSAVSIFVLILDGKTALEGATAGIELCIRTLIPALFPFLILSSLLTRALAGQPMKLLQPLCSKIGIPQGAESLLAISLLGGYPIGAQSIALLHSEGKITTSQATHLLAFCNNAGPAFIFGVLGSMFSDPRTPWILWFTHILSALFVGLCVAKPEPVGIVHQNPSKVQITVVLLQSIKTMALICGWVICVKIILSFIELWFLKYFSLRIQIIIFGILELSNGCLRLSEIESEATRFLIATFLLSLGGLCVTLQTASVVDGIPMKLYFPGKILQCSISLVLSYVFLSILFGLSYFNSSLLFIISISISIAIVSFFQYSKKTVEFRRPLMYN